MALGYIPLDLTLFQYLILHLAFILSFGYGLLFLAKNRAVPNEVDQNLKKTGELSQPSDPQDACSFCVNLCYTRNENMSLQSERDNWEMRARHAEDRLYSFRKENEHQHENELISNAEKQARQMLAVTIQIEVETGVAERKKQEEYIRMLQNEYAKAKSELQEQKKCVQRLSVGLDEATQFPMRIAEETRQKLANALSAVAAAAAEACAICLTNEKDMAFGCGHMTCRYCGSKIRNCHICSKKITCKIRVFPG